MKKDYYEILENLQSKGFISKIIKDGVMHFSAAPPSIIEGYLEKKRLELKKQQAAVNSSLVDLMKIYSENSKDVSVEVFTGKKGMKSSYEILLSQAKKDSNLYVLGTNDQVNSISWLKNFLETHLYPKRKRLKLQIKKLMNVEARGESFWLDDNSKLRFTHLTSFTSFEVLGDVVIIQILQGEGVFVVLRGAQVAKDYKNQFDLLWKNAKGR